jgi:hypothetical protein
MVAACIPTALVLTACGAGGPKTVTVVEVQHHPKPAALRVPHTGKPSQCTVWLTTGSALVTFQGNGYPVTPSCNSWVTNSAKHGTLWTTQTPSDLGPYLDGSTVCRVRAKNGWEYATVVDAQPDPDGDGQASCEGLLSTNEWTYMSETSADRPPRTTFEDQPVAGTPKVRIGDWTGRQPSLIDFSADGSNGVTNLRWTTWDKTQALGKGQSQIQTCLPSCGAGGVMPVNAYILLTDPVNGRFTHLTESQGGQIFHALANDKVPSLAQMRNDKRIAWPWQALSYGRALAEYRQSLSGTSN